MKNKNVKKNKNIMQIKTASSCTHHTTQLFTSLYSSADILTSYAMNKL